jgi:hypothetical protein
MIAALLHAAGLAAALKFGKAERKRLKDISNGEGLGAAVESVAASAAAAISAAAVVSSGGT